MARIYTENQELIDKFPGFYIHKREAYQPVIKTLPARQKSTTTPSEQDLSAAREFLGDTMWPHNHPVQVEESTPKRARTTKTIDTSRFLNGMW